MSTRVSIVSPDGVEYDLGIMHGDGGTVMFANPAVFVEHRLDIQRMRDVLFYLDHGYTLKNEYGDAMTFQDLNRYPVRKWE